jgi:hypothetical protein
LIQIQSINSSPFACQIAAVLKLDETDDQIATKVAIVNPMASEECSKSMKTLATLLSTNKIEKVKDTFKAVLEAFLDVRARLPSIFSFDPKLVLVDM